MKHDGKSKGFTLVEILSVVVIMGVLLIIAVPGVMGVQKNVKDEMFCNKTRVLEKAARLYGQDYYDDVIEDGLLPVTVKELIDNNLFEKENENCLNDPNVPCVLDPRNGNSMDEEKLTIVVKEKNIRAFFNYKATDVNLCEGKTKEQQAGTYEISFDNNKATFRGEITKKVLYGYQLDPITPPKKEYDVKFNDTATGFSESKHVSYKFLGYFRTNSPSSEKYYNSDGTGARTYNIPDHSILFAQWEYYDIEFPSVNRTGYTFTGWYNSNGTRLGGAYEKYRVLSDLDLQARWNANSYVVNLDGQGATTPGSKQVSATFDRPMPSIAVPVRTGYTFKGYYTEPNGGGTPYYNEYGTSANNWNIASNTTLYAKWTANNYEVELESLTATQLGTTKVTATFDKDMPSINIPRKVYTLTFNYNGSGQGNSTLNVVYGFEGYYTSVSGKGTKYYQGNGVSARTWNIANKTKLYENWTQGSVSLPNASRSGYTFLGWYTDAGVYVGKSGTVYSTNANRTLYAHWKRNSYPATYNHRTCTSRTNCRTERYCTGTEPCDPWTCDNWAACCNGANTCGCNCYQNFGYTCCTGEAEHTVCDESSYDCSYYSCPNGGSLSGSTCYY